MSLLPTSAVDSASNYLSHHSIQFIRLQWIDLNNIVRYRVLPVSRFLKLLQNGERPGVCIAKVGIGIVFCTPAEGFNAMGEFLFVPDLDSIKICKYAQGQASVFGWFQHKTIPSPRQPFGYESDICPRTILRRVVEKAKIDAGLTFLFGFETEFILLLKPKDGSTCSRTPVNSHGWSVSKALLSDSIEAKAVEAMATALVQSGIDLETFHAEAAPGQYEIVTGPLPPLEAADALIHTRETIYNIANKFGLKATLVPRLFGNSCGSASHMHFSVHPSNSSSTASGASSSPRMTSTESSFIASVLQFLPALAYLTMPLPSSYGRMVDGIWSGGTYVCWGSDNREAPLRLCIPPDLPPTSIIPEPQNSSLKSSRNHFELKCMDAFANPYAVIAALIGIGTRGVIEQKQLLISDCPGPKSAAEMSEGEREALGIKDRMPMSWDEARERFTAAALPPQGVFSEVLGEGMANAILNVNQAYVSALKSLGEAESEQSLLDTF